MCAAAQTPPRLDDARRLFKNVFAMKYEPDAELLRPWFFAERNSGYGIDECLRIANFVSAGKRYSEVEKLEFLSRKGAVLFTRAREDGPLMPDRALAYFQEALGIHLLCYRKWSFVDGPKLGKAEEYARNTAFSYFDFILTSLARPDLWLDAMLSLTEMRDYVLDPIEDPIVRALAMGRYWRGGKGELNRLKGRLEFCRKSISGTSLWDDQSARTRISQAFSDTVQALVRKMPAE
jgi:hypothetical protein